MYLEHKRLFIAGATGLVGSSILKFISDKHPTTRVCASYFNTEPFIKDEKIEYVHGDLRSYEDCRKMVKGCDYAIMAAAFTGGSRLTVTQPWRHIKDNVMMNMQMLEAFHAEGVKRLIYIGSATLYQEYEGHIGEEQLDMNKEPHNAYFGFGWGVRFIEKLCKLCNERYGIEVIIVRAANIFGPYAKFNPEASNFIPAIIRKSVKKMEPFEVWGSPDVTRDVIYSDDFARAITMIMENNSIFFDIFNIGSGVRTTVGNVVQWSLKHAGYSPAEIKYIQNNTATSKFRVLDCAKAKKVLNWEPQYTVEEGIKKTTEWWVKNKDWWKK